MQRRATNLRAKSEPRFLVFNGVDAETGTYLRPPISVRVLERRLAARKRAPRLRGLKGRLDPRDLSQAGWGAVWAPGLPAGIRDALQPLLTHRKAAAAGRDERRFRDGLEYQPGETSLDFLARYGKAAGPADPDLVPYYLLLVGDPESIPYDVQYQLDVQYAVGRIWFATLDEYRHYAESVVAAERRAPPARRAVLFAPEHPDDELSRISARQFAQPLAERLREEPGGWQIETRLGEEATKEQLGRLLGGTETPCLLLSAGHGIGRHLDDPRQREHQGALVCQSWPGPRSGRLSADDYFSAGDLAADARLQGLVTFLFACYSAGTPRWDSYAHLLKGRRELAARHAFVARLPQRLLAHSQGGALAVIGHVDQIWPCSLLWERTGIQLAVFETAFAQMLAGVPIGAALEAFGQRYAEIAAEISARLEPAQEDASMAAVTAFKLWLAHNDARSYTLLGDPAVRLPSAPPRQDAADE